MPRARVVLIITAVIVAAIGISIVAVRTTYPESTPEATIPPSSSSVVPSVRPTPSASPTPTIDPVIAWADRVCDASFDIRDTLAAAGEDLAVTPGPDALDEIRARLERRGDVIIGQLEPLAVALGEVPVDVPEALRLASTLSTQVDTLRQSADRTRAAFEVLTQAQGLLEFGQALPEAVSAVGAAGTAAQVVAGTVADAASDEGSRLGPGFRASPTCRALVDGTSR